MVALCLIGFIGRSKLHGEDFVREFFRFWMILLGVNFEVGREW